MRARYPDSEGFVERDGVKVAYEVFGAGEPALVFAPTDPCPLPGLEGPGAVPGQDARVVTIDPRGNGRSDRPESTAAYADTEFVADTIAVMDAAGVDRAVLVGICTSAWTTLLAAALHPDRVLGVVSIATWAPFLTPPSAVRAVYDFDEAWTPTRAGPRTTGTTGCGLARLRRVLLRRAAARAALDQAAGGLVGWAMETSAETTAVRRRAALLVQPRGDRGDPGPGELPGAGHPRRGRPLPAGGQRQRAGRRVAGRRAADAGRRRAPPAGREPVVVNRAIRDFADRFRPAPAASSGRRTWTRPLNRPRRVLYLSSPIGLGHARRDLAIADELRKLGPASRWTGWPSTRSPSCCGGAEQIHPASAFLASESGHIESEAASTTCTPSRRCGPWTRSWSPTSWSSPSWSRTSSTTCGSATRPGTSTTSCTRTPSSSARRSPG